MSVLALDKLSIRVLQPNRRIALHEFHALIQCWKKRNTCVFFSASVEAENCCFLWGFFVCLGRGRFTDAVAVVFSRPLTAWIIYNERNKNADDAISNISVQLFRVRIVFGTCDSVSPPPPPWLLTEFTGEILALNARYDKLCVLLYSKCQINYDSTDCDKNYTTIYLMYDRLFCSVATCCISKINCALGGAVRF